MAPWHIVLDGSEIPSREAIGNKARGIALMRSRGLPVPPAFVLPTEVGRRYVADGALPEEAWEAALQGIARLESETGRTFGAGPSPLLVSVRSGAAASMPGMMDTILDLGMNDAVQDALAAETGDRAFAADTHRRFIASYEKSVPGSDPPGPADEQLRGAICAVFASWSSPRAKAYRDHWSISHDGGTAVTVQAMVFGNLDDASGTGVFFTRNPHSGAREAYGEFLPRGQGEDVVSGEVQPVDLVELSTCLPDVHAALLEAGATLEREAGDVQDVEFTVERGRLYLLQTRTAKRSHEAAIRIAVGLVDDGMATPEAALGAIRPEHIETLMAPVIDSQARADAEVLYRGEPGCPGIAAGEAVGDADAAQDASAEGRPVVLVRRATSPEDVHGMIAAEGVLTEVGGRTSHAAVVSRELGRPAVVGCGAGTVTALIGREITIDGATGEVFDGALRVCEPTLDDRPELARLVAWAAEHPDALAGDHPLRALGSQPESTAT